MSREWLVMEDGINDLSSRIAEAEARAKQAEERAERAEARFRVAMDRVVRPAAAIWCDWNQGPFYWQVPATVIVSAHELVQELKPEG